MKKAEKAAIFIVVCRFSAQNGYVCGIDLCEKVIAMLLEFRVANFRSFKGEQVLNLIAGADKKHPKNVLDKGRYKVLKTAAIFGANASGKSNLIKAIDCMCRFVLNSATTMNQGDPIPGISPFRLDTEAKTRPSLFEITTNVDGTVFRYGFAATRERVWREWLFASRSPGGREELWLEREYDTATQETTYVCRGPLRSEKEVLEEKTRDNALALSRAAELNIKAVVGLFVWFRKKLWVFDLSDPAENLVQATAMHMHEDRDLFQRVAGLVPHADLGIASIEVEEKPVQPSKLSSREIHGLFSRGVLRNRKTDGLVTYQIMTTHARLSDEPEEVFDLYEDESKGTQRFFALSGPLMDAVKNGAVVVVDEFEASLHPLLSRKLIELFQSLDPKDAKPQLVFATHDSTLMDPRLFRRDQIWFTEKNREEATELFSLYDFNKESRSTEVFQRNYLAGKYGAIPSFGPLFEGVES